MFMKLFKTNNIDIVKYCQYCFGFEIPSELLAKRISKLNEKIANCSNSFVVRFSQV